MNYWIDVDKHFFYHMQTRIDWTTGGLGFYDVDPPKEEAADLFLSDHSINQQFDPVPSQLPLQQRIDLIKSVGCEVVGEELLGERLQRKEFIKCYDGFEPSGRIHIAQGLLRAINVNKMVEAGAIFYFWVADYFAMLNGKFEGDLEKIRTVGKYFIEVWRAVGMKMSNVKFLWASEEINKRSNEYWLKVMEVACQNSIARIKKCATIMGRNESDGLKVSQLIYPCMQCTDIFFLDVDVCQLGIDQRKVNMLAIEMAPPSSDKPIVVSHGMLSGLIEGQEKMSKSNPDSAIFMEDSSEEVVRKIKKAYCPPKVLDPNPILDYCKNIVFGARDSIQVLRAPDNGGNKYPSPHPGPTTPSRSSRRTSRRASCTPGTSSRQCPRCSTS
jgi:tyrosyl-tRNA synthetase